MVRGSTVCLLLLFSFCFGNLFSANAETLTLEQVIREVCTKSDSAKMMRESVKKADEMVREKWSNVYPIISASATGARSYGSAFGGGSGSGGSSRTIATASAADDFRVSPTAPDPYMTREEFYGFMESLTEAFSTPHTSTVYSAGLSVTQPLYTFGKVGTAIKVAEMFNESAKNSYNRNSQTLQLQAIDAYFAALLADKGAEVAERILNRKKELHEFLKGNFDLGSGSKAQVLMTGADAMLQGPRLIDARRNAVRACRYLSLVMGRPLADSLDLDTTALPSSVANPIIIDHREAVRSAVESRSDLKALHLLAESNKGGAKILRAMYLPSIAAFGSTGWSKYESGSSIMSNDGMGNWMVGVGLSWTLFDGFANSAKAAQFMSDAKKLDIAGSTMRKMVEIEIRDDFLECQAADSNLAATQEMHSAARESYDLAYDNFKEGSGQLADLQRVDELLQQAEFGLLNARYRQIRSRAALLVAMGKDLITIDREDGK
ncbi:MAG: TolC family protein [Chitinispirillaceae bacterium]|nr:TolC family protein [Chitinispirillaceae bacterium]